MGNIKKLLRLCIPRLFRGTVVLLIVCVSMYGRIGAQAVTQGYDSDQSLQRGMIVRLKENDTTKIEPVTQEHATATHGVVVDPNDAPVTISTEGQKTFVATTGKFSVLVSDQNGPIKAGEYVTISAVAGIGMKVDDKQPVVVGRALNEFDGKEGVIGNAKAGDQDIRIGRVTVDVNIAGNPLQKPPDTNIPEFLRKAAESIAQKPVNTTRIYLSLVVLAASAMVSGSLLYAGVRSGIISIGRNPLSKKSIIRGMVQVVIVGLTIFLAGIFGVYLLLRL